MPEIISTDDAPRRIRQVWLGPKGLRIGIEPTYPQLFAFVGLWALAGPIAVVVTYLQVGGALFSFALGMLGWGPVLAAVATWAAMKGVSPDEPLLYRVRMLARQVRPRRAAQVESVTVEIGFPTITEMTPGVRRALTGRAPSATSPARRVAQPTHVAPAITTTAVKETHVDHPPDEEKEVGYAQPRPRRAAETNPEAKESYKPRRAAS